MKRVLVFKTSVTRKKEIKKLRPVLNKLINREPWNFDLEDCDNILRVESQNIESVNICRILKENGFYCEELL